MAPIVLQQLRKAIIYGEFPSKAVNVQGIPFIFTFTDQAFSSRATLPEYVEFFSRTVMCRVRNRIIPITDLPGLYFGSIHSAYGQFHSAIIDELSAALPEFTELNESIGLWEVYKHCDPSHVLSLHDGKLNWIQQQWILRNSMTDANADIKLIADVFDAAKPWLDRELFFHVQEQSENTRENVFFDDEEQDTILRQKAADAVKLARSKESGIEGTDDIVVIEENA